MDPIKNMLIGCVGMIVITVLLVPIPFINIYGAIVGRMVAYIITSAANIITLKAKLGVRINYYDVLIKPAYSAVFMILSVVFAYQYVYNNTMSNTLGIFVL